MLGTFGGLFLFTLIRDRRYFPVFLIPFVILYFSLPNVKRTVTNTSFEEYSVNQRLSMYKASPQVFKNHWLSGVGPGNVKEAYQDEVKEYKMKYSHVHNIYLQILLETGIIGFISFLWLFFEVIKLSILLYKNRKNALVRNTALAAGCGIVGFLIAGLFENNFGDTEVVMPVFFLIGILVAIKNEELN
jgi:O-antigen ligase